MPIPTLLRAPRAFSTLRPFFAVAATGGLFVTAAPAQESPLKVSGYLDGYFETSFRRPGGGTTVALRNFDTLNERATLASAALNVGYAPKNTPFSGTLSLWAGKNADLIRMYDTDRSRFAQHVVQAYATYTAPTFTLDLGKFGSWIGYEGYESPGNDNYGRGLLYTAAEPLYHTGLRASFPLGKGVTGGLYAVTGWSETSGGNGRPAFGASLKFAPDDATSIGIGVFLGKEGDDQPNRAGSFGGIGFGAPGDTEVSLVNITATRKLTDKIRLGANIDVASAKGPNSGNWRGLGLYAAYDHDAKNTVAARLEGFEDTSGVRLGVAAKAYSATLTWTHRVNPRADARLELRRDFASQPGFTSSSGAVSSQTTLAAALVWKY
ncbi:MAG: outer membrane beta-barrel protein [Fimbriimonadaceae bacterium]|nr:outer membrane beta-barrel protein [Fimbriimonadaceae bacterium]